MLNVQVPYQLVGLPVNPIRIVRILVFAALMDVLTHAKERVRFSSCLPRFYLEFIIYLLVILSDTTYRVSVLHLMFSFHLKYNYERLEVLYICMHEVVFNCPNRLRDIQQVQIVK